MINIYLSKTVASVECLSVKQGSTQNVKRQNLAMTLSAFIYNSPTLLQTTHKLQINYYKLQTDISR